MDKHELGYVYIFTNESFRDGWVKIGKTQNVKKRLRDLDNTSCPMPFKVYATMKTCKYNEAEELVQEFIAHFNEKLRVRPNREYFKVSPEEALKIFYQVKKVIDDAQIRCYGDDDEPESKIIYKLGIDYSLGYDDDGNLILSVISGGALTGKTRAFLTYTKLKPELVTANDIIGGINSATGDKKGLELIGEVFPKFRLIPGLIAAPKWSEKPAVAAVMRAKCENINGVFTAMSVVDIPSSADGADVYSEVAEWKNTNNYMSEFQIACWPLIKLDDKVFHLSTQLIGLINSVDNDNGDIPFESPSNKNLQMNACINSSGKEIYLGKDQADLLNSQGVVTALNFYGGWKAWGNRTAIYPSSTDPKDDFIPIRRMFNWIRNEFTLTFWQKVDKPITYRLIRSIVDSFNVRLNGLRAIEAIIDGRIEFITLLQVRLKKLKVFLSMILIISKP